MSNNILNDISKVYSEQVAESAVPGQPAERLGAVTAIPKSEQDAARQRTLAKAAAIRAKKGIKESTKAKPDYLDFDGDGNKKESMKKALRDKAKQKVEEAKKPNDGNLANNYPPYDKVTRGDVIAGRLGKDQMGGKRKVTKEGYSNWRQDLSEVMTDKESDKKITEKKVNNKVTINPKLQIGEAIQNLGGELIEMVEIEESSVGDRARNAVADQRLDDSQRETQASVDKLKKGPKGVTRASAHIAAKKSERIARNMHPKSGTTGAYRIPEEVELDERTLTAPETKKKEEIVKSMKKNLSGFKSRYGARAKEVMYATATKQAKKVAEQATEIAPKTQQPTPAAQATKPNPAEVARQKQLVQIQKKQAMDRLAQLNKGVPITSESAADVMAAVKASVAQKYGAASIVGSPEHKAAQAKKAAQPQPEKPQRKLPGYSIPGASAPGMFRKSYVD
jgi:hypothetical protein